MKKWSRLIVVHWLSLAAFLLLCRLRLALLHTKHGINRRLTLWRRAVALWGALEEERADVYSLLQQSLDEVVVAGCRLRAIVAVAKPEILQPLALLGREDDRDGFASRWHAANYITSYRDVHLGLFNI